MKWADTWITLAWPVVGVGLGGNNKACLTAIFEFNDEDTRIRRSVGTKPVSPSGLSTDLGYFKRI